MSKIYMKNAYEALQEAEYNKNQFPKASIRRAYYSMFYAAHSALITEGIEAKSHEGVNNLFAEKFVKTEKFPKKIFKTLGRMEADRYDADYDPIVEFSLQDAEKHIEYAEIFVNTVKQMLIKEQKDSTC